MDNKPYETDDQQESSEEELDNIFNAEPEDETPQETGSEDVGSASFKDKLEALAGRTFKDEADAEKHYKNLASFVGKSQEKAKPEAEPDVLTKLTSLEQRIAERDFMFEVPEAKEHLDLIRDTAKSRNIPLNEAWDKVKEYVGALETSKKEKTIVESKNRPNVAQNKEFQALAEKAKTEGLNSSEQAELVKSYLGKL